MSLSKKTWRKPILKVNLLLLLCVFHSDSSPNVSAAADHLVVSNFWFTENKREQLVCNLRGLSASEGMRKLRAMPLSLADKMEIRYTRH